MVAQPEKTNHLEDVLTWISDEVTSSMNLSAAAVNAAAKANHQGLISGPLWNEIGPRVLNFLWRLDIQTKRSNMLVMGPRRIDAAALASQESLLGAPIRVNGMWTTIGELTKEGCLTVSQDYQKLAQKNLQRSTLFDQLAQKLKRNQKVGQRFTEEQLREFIVSIGPE